VSKTDSKTREKSDDNPYNHQFEAEECDSNDPSSEVSTLNMVELILQL